MKKLFMCLGLMCILMYACVSLSEDQRLSNLGFEALAKNDLKSAQKYLEDSYAINPDNPYTILNLGVVYQNTGKNTEAMKYYDKLIAMDPPETAAKSNKEGEQGKRLVDIAKDNIKAMKK
jgi:general secretion pathway protein D